MVHQPGKFYTIIEVEQEMMEPLFYTLNDFRKDVFLKPSQSVIDHYLPMTKHPVIIKHLITESPLQSVDSILTITLEKILIDIYCDSDLFHAQQGAEMRRIYKHAIEHYQLNDSKILRYANRRNQRKAIENYLTNIRQ